jgi:Mg2+-importing ATPase
MKNEIRLRNVEAGRILLRQLKNPLLLILIVTTIVAFAFGERFNSMVVAGMMAISIFLGFWNEYRAEKTTADLLKKISFTATVIRNGVKQSIPVRDIVVGDQVLLYPGTIVPADMTLIKQSGLEVNEAVLSGESMPVLKGESDKTTYMGTVIVSGTGQGVVTHIGSTTKFGQLAVSATAIKPETEFQKGLGKFGVLLVRVISVMGVVIFLINGLLGRDWFESGMFALSVAIGLTPELLPVVVTVSLAHGAKMLAKKDIIVKQLVAIEDLGNMEILCCDKTGTLTEGKLTLVSHQNAGGAEDPLVLREALLCNAAVVHHKIFGDAIDKAIWEHAISQGVKYPEGVLKIKEQPFDYEYRGMFTVTEENGKRNFVFKGAPEVVLGKCINNAILEKANTRVKKWYEDGYRVIAIGSKTVSKTEQYTFEDAKELNLIGFVLFTDPPKHGVRLALEHFAKLGVQLKIVTGDNEAVALKISKDIGLLTDSVITGPDLNNMTDKDLEEKAKTVNIFARMTPDKKLRVIRALRHGGHTVGYIGDGINDAPALLEADAGISVNTAVDVAKDTASIVLLHKSLNVIVDGIREGRRTFANTLKYILMGTSSNFGNMFSMAGASFLLPFLPMSPSQVLLTNAIYDSSQLSLPTDNVDDEELQAPKKWDIGIIKKYMLFFGPISSIYDFLTFGMMYFMFKAKDSMFQTGWFIESLTTQILVVFMIRTTKVPFFKSKPSLLLTCACLGAVAAAWLLPYSPLAKYFKFTPLPPTYFGLLVIMTITYLGLVELGKLWVLDRKKYGQNS